MLCGPRLAFGSQAVLGTVKDTTGAVVPGAVVILSNTATGIPLKTTTNATGNYQFPSIDIGVYNVTAQKAGFASAVAASVRVLIGARQMVNLTLQPGKVTQKITVSGAAPLVESATTSHGQVIHVQQITQIPLNDRDPTRLALLAAGVTVSANDMGDFSSGRREGSFNINGLRDDQNDYQLDGVDNNEMGTSNQGFSLQVVQLSPDALQEFKVETDNVDAQYGRGGGAQVIAVTKSGTNHYRGDLWEFNRNRALNAAGFFAGAGKPQFVRNQFGGTFGGPIARNRAFFFIDAELFRQRTSNNSFSTLPTLNDRQGIFDVPVQNPLTSQVYPANSGIPSSAMSPFAQKVLSYLPAPNLGTGRANNYEILVPQSINIHHEDLKIDDRVSQRLSVFARVSNRFALSDSAAGIPGLSGGDSNGSVHVFNEALASGATWTLSPTSLLDFRLGITKTSAGKKPIGSGGPNMQQLFGITGLPADPTLTGGLTAQSISGFSQLGRQATNPQWQNPTVYNPKVDYTLVRGKHTFKAGYEFEDIHVAVQDLNTVYGKDTYSGQFSKPTGGTGSSATYNFADFLFGLRSQYQLETYLVGQMRQHMHFAYFQDSWSATRKLTVNWGMRYEFATPLWEAHNHLSNFDPSTDSIVLAKPGSIFNRSTIHPDYKDFGPRIGLAYAYNPKTVFRASYGIFFNHGDRVGSGNILAINGPQVVQATIVQSPDQPGFRTTDQGYPTGLIDPSTFNPEISTMAALDQHTHAEYVQQWFAGIERQVSHNTYMDLSYVGNHMVKGLMFVDLNQAKPNDPQGNIPLSQRRFLYPGFSTISAGLPVALSNYNALQAKVEHRWTKGLYFLDSFTYSHAIDNSTLALENPGGTTAKPQNYFALAAEYGTSIYNQPLVNTASVVWNLPYGRGERFGSHTSPFLNGLLGGWQYSMFFTSHSGQPINLYYSPASSFQVSGNLSSWLGGVQLRPNITGSIQSGNGEGQINNYFNKSNILIPTDPSQPFGNAGRNIGRGPRYNDFDIGVQKSFPLPRLREGTDLEFSAQFFNAFNHTNLNLPNSSVSSSAFGTIRSAFDPREIQLGLKLYF